MEQCNRRRLVSTDIWVEEFAFTIAPFSIEFDGPICSEFFANREVAELALSVMSAFTVFVEVANFWILFQILFKI